MPGNCRTEPSLYRCAAGETFDRLPAVLRDFHGRPAGGCAEGVLCITRGSGTLRGLCADLMRLPAAGAAVPVKLEVRGLANRERWTRDFGAHRLITEQWHRDGLLIEQAGPMRFGFRLTGDETCMVFDMQRSWLFGLPLPRFLSPRVDAVVTGHGSCAWWTVVNVRVPVFGQVVRYEGEMRPCARGGGSETGETRC